MYQKLTTCQIILIIIVVIFGEFGTKTQDLTCCTHTSSGSCRNICGNISIVELAVNSNSRNHTLNLIRENCAEQMVTFWECLNATFKDISKGDSWAGRICCSFSQSENCRKACATGTSKDDLSQNCRRSDEISLFTCIDKLQIADQCCGNAKNQRCDEICRELLRGKLTPNKDQREKLEEECMLSSPKVIECVNDITKVTPVTSTSKHIHCCDRSNNFKCREACRDALSKKNTVQEIIDELTLGGCGLPLPQEHFWQCFLYPTIDQQKTQDASSSSTSIEMSRIERLGMDSAKWHCCHHAKSIECNRLCSKTFTKSWATSWEDFNFKCLSNVNEVQLRNCIDEVDEPCELGCDGLSYCNNFNNRPTQLFRSCTLQTDEVARNEVTLWQNQSNISMHGLTLSMKYVNEKHSNIWKAIACILEIKPCSRQLHVNQICRDVCLQILSQYVDLTRISPIYSAESICEHLSPSDPSMPCIRIDDYLTPSSNVGYANMSGQISSPCKGNPCNLNEICLINRNCAPGGHCKAYYCKAGCKLGEVSQYMVPDGTYVRIPIPTNPKGCLQICKCKKNKIEECQPLPCFPYTSCLLGNTNQLHGSNFKIDCNSCSCYAGEMTCTKKQCESSNLIESDNLAYSTLPCDCPLHYVPVCGRNGITYPSACLAKCAGLNDADIDLMPCENPCKRNICPIGQKCVPNPRVCLSLMQKPCDQYECINGSANCDHFPYDPVCDLFNRTYPNSCYLAHHNAKLAYKGPCLSRCQNKGQVCGINGRTYTSECAAHSEMVSVDYEGACSSIGPIINVKSKQCSNVKCAPLPDTHCLGITPPGACCPLCGGALRLLYSRKQIDRALYALQNKSIDQINLKALLKALERQIQIAQCAVRGYITVETDIFIAVISSERKPSRLQLEICIREAEKLANLINLQSHRISIELSLSSLTLATPVHTDIIMNNAHSIYLNSSLMLIFVSVVFKVMF